MSRGGFSHRRRAPWRRHNPRTLFHARQACLATLAVSENGVKGLVPCGLLGRSPDTSESLVYTIKMFGNYRTRKQLEQKFYVNKFSGWLFHSCFLANDKSGSKLWIKNVMFSEKLWLEVTSLFYFQEWIFGHSVHHIAKKWIWWYNYHKGVIKNSRQWIIPYEIKIPYNIIRLLGECP